MSEVVNVKINELVSRIAAGAIHVADVTEVNTDGGVIVHVHCESMEEGDVLGFVISLPGEVRDRYEV